MTMCDKDFDRLLESFISEIKELDLDTFRNPECWTLCEVVGNGVEIGYEIETAAERKILHHIGQKYNLIPLCPNDQIGVDYSSKVKPFSLVVETAFGKLPIKRENKDANK